MLEYRLSLVQSPCSTMSAVCLPMSGREEKLYQELRQLEGLFLKSLEDSFRDLKLEYAIQIRSLLPPLLQLCQMATASPWGGKSSRLQLIVRLLAFATGVTTEDFYFSSYALLLPALKSVSDNLKGLLLHPAADCSRGYVTFCIERIANLRHSLISQVDTSAPWPDKLSSEKFSRLPSDCFRYLIRNFLYRPHDLLALALTNHSFFTLVFDRSLWEEILHAHSPLDPDYRPQLPIGIVVDNYSIICYVIKFYHERYKRKYVKEQQALLKRCVTCGIFFWSFQSSPSYSHTAVCRGSYFLDFTAKDFIAYLHKVDR